MTNHTEERKHIQSYPHVGKYFLINGRIYQCLHYYSGKGYRLAAVDEVGLWTADHVIHRLDLNYEQEVALDTNFVPAKNGIPIGRVKPTVQSAMKSEISGDGVPLLSMSHAEVHGHGCRCPFCRPDLWPGDYLGPDGELKSGPKRPVDWPIPEKPVSGQPNSNSMRHRLGAGLFATVYPAHELHQDVSKAYPEVHLEGMVDAVVDALDVVDHKFLDAAREGLPMESGLAAKFWKQAIRVLKEGK